MKKLLLMTTFCLTTSIIWPAARPEHETAAYDLSPEARLYRETIIPELIGNLNNAMRFRQGKIFHPAKADLDAYRKHAEKLGDRSLVLWIDKILETFPSDTEKHKPGVNGFIFETNIKSFLQHNNFPADALKKLPSYKEDQNLIESLRDILGMYIKPGETIHRPSPEILQYLIEEQSKTKSPEMQGIIAQVREILQSNTDYDTFKMFGVRPLIRAGFPKEYIP